MPPPPPPVGNRVNSIFIKSWHSQLTFLIDCGRQYPCTKFHLLSSTNNRDNDGEPHWSNAADRTLRRSRNRFDKVGVRYLVNRGLLYPVFDIAKFDCMYDFSNVKVFLFQKRMSLPWIWGGGGGGGLETFHSITDHLLACSLYLHYMFTVFSLHIHQMFIITNF